jgi:hypothetical protein
MYVVQIYLLFSYVSYIVRHSRHYDMVDRYGINVFFPISDNSIKFPFSNIKVCAVTM